MSDQKEECITDKKEIDIPGQLHTELAKSALTSAWIVARFLYPAAVEQQMLSASENFKKVSNAWRLSTAPV